MSEPPTQGPARKTANYFRTRAIFVGVIVVFALASELTRDVREMYRGRATIQVDQPMFMPQGDGAMPSGASSHWFAKLNTMVEMFPSSKLMEQVIRDHDLLHDVEFAGPDANENSLGRLARMLASRTSSRLRSNTELIDITLIHRNPRLARDLVNWIAQGFIKQQSNRSLQDQRFALSILTNEAERLKLRLRNAEIALIDFRKSSNLVISLEERQAILSNRIAVQAENLTTLATEIAIIQDDLDLIKSYGDAPTFNQLRSVPSISNSPRVQELHNQLEATRLHLRSVDRSEQDPTTTESQEETVNELLSNLNYTIEQTPLQLEQNLTKLRVSAATAKNLLKQTENESLQLAAHAVEYNVLEREVVATESLLESVLNRIKEMDLGPDPHAPVLTVVQEADSASDMTPDRNANAMEAGLIALVLSITAVFLFDKLRPLFPQPQQKTTS